MTTYLQLLSLDTVSCSPCIVVATESSRFLFDSGEGVQRLCNEHRARISKLEGVYLTRLCPETVGGLPGLFLTAADSGKSQFSIVGPRGTASFWASTGHFMRRSMFSISISELEPMNPILSQKYLDMTIHSLPIGLTHSSFICETPQLAGKFDVAKALSLKIPKGSINLLTRISSSPSQSMKVNSLNPNDTFLQIRADVR
jgi:ribonuclease Z